MVVYAICYLDMFGLKSIPTTPGSRAQRALIELHDFVNFKFTDDGVIFSVESPIPCLSKRGSHSYMAIIRRDLSDFLTKLWCYVARCREEGREFTSYNFPIV